MQAIKRYGVVNQGLLILYLPQEFDMQEMQVIILPLEKENAIIQKNKFRLSSLKSTLKDETEISIDAKLKSLRAEWERNIL